MATGFSKSLIITPKENKVSKSMAQSEFRKNTFLFVFLIPGLLFMLLFNYIPMFGTIMAFLKIKGFKKNFLETIFSSEWAGLKNFDFLFKSPDAFLITRNTILYNAAFIGLGLIASVAVAIAINELSFKKFAKFVHTTYFLPYFLSWVIVSYLAFALLSADYGIINKLLSMFGVEQVIWYNESKYWPGIFIFANLWKYTGYNSVVYLAAITSINPEYYDAATIDGASKWQQIWNITIPLIKPMIIILSILAVGRIFVSDFGLFYNLPLGSGPLREVSSTIDMYVYRSLTVNNTSLSLAAAAGFYQSVVGLVLVLATNTIVKKIDKGYALF